MATRGEQDRDFRRLLGIGLGLSVVIHGAVLALGHVSLADLGGTDAIQSAEESSDPARWRETALEVVQLEAPAARATGRSPSTSTSGATSSPARTLPADLHAAARVRLPRSMVRPPTSAVSRSESAFPAVELEWRRPSHLYGQVTFTAASRAARDAGGRPGSAGDDDRGPEYVFPGGSGGGGGIDIGVSGGGGCSGPVIGTIGGFRLSVAGGR